jgi:two-component system, chemotaxis family, sensor kinase CheA
VFRAGSQQPKAVPLSLVTRLEEIDCKKIELSNGRHLVQYRGQLMPLVRVSDEACVRSEGAQPLLVFSDSGRTMGLAVDEIVDIVEDKLDIEVGSDTPGVIGSAVIKGQATEIIDVGHYLPLAFEDWFKRKEMSEDALTRRLLFVDDSPFFRNMLTPVLKAAGYQVTAVAGAQEALALAKAGHGYSVVVSDIEMPEMNGFELAEALRADPKTAQLPIIALSSLTNPAAIERGRQAGFHDYVAKFDRQGLIAALRETAVEYGAAA